jgi:S-DNA-T family DNA segregation ATPase FtsK/SpoIIIE
MASRRRKPARRKPARGRSRSRARRSYRIRPRLPVLDQSQKDVLGLGLVAGAVFFAFVFYLGWDGGQVGEAFADGFVWLFGGVGYLVPIALFVAGAVLVIGPMVPTVKPFKAGGLMLLVALMLGLAAGTFGLGPDDPPRDAAFETPSWFRHHGGAVGEGLFWVTRTLVQEIGAHILFVFLFVAGFMLLTGASIAGVIRATSESVRTTTRRVKRSTTEFARVKQQPDPAEPPEPPHAEPVVRATHVEAPSIEEEWDDEVPEVVEGQELDTEDGEEDDEFIVHAAPPSPAQPKEPQELTPMGNVRSAVTEADDNVYTLPPARHLKRGSAAAKAPAKGDEKVGQRLTEALGHFGIDAQIVGTVAGPHVTRYELKLAPGIKMSKVANLKDDIAYALAASEIRILAPIPGKTAVGVEVPNSVRRIVHLGDVFQEAPAGWSPLTVWLGKDIAGKAIGTDLAKQPHVLVAGTTGSGKSGCVNAMLTSILLRATPNDVKLVLVDPKQVELNHYEGIPHLITPVVTSPRIAANVLQNLIKEMEERYSVMSVAKTRSLIELNKVREKNGEKPLPYILCVIDELADLMMIAPAEVEDAVIRLAQKSRAVGIHLLLATQRPSADIITGMIKANVPARIAFAVSSQIDSRVILDQGGAESLLGQGDMLFRPATDSRPARIQGAYVGEDEIEKITDAWRKQGEPEIQEELLEAVETETDDSDRGDFDPDHDELLGEAISTVVQLGSASTSMLQRRLRVGYTRAGRLIDMLERRGVISGYEGSKARQVLISEADLPRILEALDEPASVSADV